MNELENAYERGTFGVSRRTFMKLAGIAGVTAMGGMLVFPDRAYGLYTEPTDPHWDALTGDKVRFTVHSDTHFTKYDMKNKFALAFNTIYEQIPDIQAHVFDGDTTENGADGEYADLVEYFNTYVKRPPIICMGNHEMYAHNGNLSEAINAFKNNALAKLTIPDMPQAPGGTHEGLVNFAGKIGGDDGYWVIAASCGLNYDYGYQIPSEAGEYGAPTPVQWMLQCIQEAVAEDPDKPVFVFTHHPMPETVHYSPENFGAGWIGQFHDDDMFVGQYAFQEKLAEYPQVIHFSGHTHIPDNDPRSIWQDGFTAVQTATFGNAFWMQGGANVDGYDNAGDTGGFPADTQDASQCLLVEVDPANGHEVTIRRMDFREGAYIGRPWTFKVSDQSTWVYSHAAMEAANKPPIVADDAQVVVSVSEPEPGENAQVSFTIPADKITADATGVEDDIVMSYRMVVRPASDPQGEPVYDACFMSDYYLASQNRPAEFTRPLFGASLEAGDYVLTAYARNPWENETQIGEPVEFTMPEPVALPMTAMLAVNFANGSANDTSEFAHSVSAYGNPTYEEAPEFGGKLVANFDGASCYGYGFAQEDYDKLAGSVTRELLVKFNELPDSGYCDIFSSGEGVGHWIEYDGSGTLYHYGNNGSACATAQIEAGVWMHLVCTFDGSALRVYRDGALVDEVEYAESYQAPRANPYVWYIGADTDGDGKAQCCSNAKIAFVNMYYGTAADDAAVAQMYAKAAVCTIADDAIAEGAFGEPEVGKLCILPTVMATDVNGAQIQAVPSVTAPDGTQVELSRVEGGEVSTLADAVTYGFTPTIEGCHEVVYTAGYGATYAVTFAVAAATTTGPDEPSTDPDKPSTDPDNPGTGDGDQGGSDKPGTGGTTGDGQGGSGSDKPGAGNGNQGGSDKPSGSDKIDPDKLADANSGSNASDSLPKTADPMGAFTTAVGAVAAVATVALGAAGAMAKKLGFDNGEDTDRQ